MMTRINFGFHSSDEWGLSSENVVKFVGYNFLCAKRHFEHAFADKPEVFHNGNWVATSSENVRGKKWHFFIGCIELIPLIGHIVAIAERIFGKIATLPSISSEPLNKTEPNSIKSTLIDPSINTTSSSNLSPEISPEQEEKEKTQKQQNVARNAEININTSINVNEKFDEIMSKIIDEILKISPLDHTSNLIVGLLIIKVSNGVDCNVVKHDFLPFAQHNPNLKNACCKKIQKVQEELTREIKEAIHERLSIKWTVLIKARDDVSKEDCFHASHGNAVKDPQCNLNHSGNRHYHPQRAGEEFKKILTDMGCSHDLLQPFNLPDAIELDSIDDIDF